MPIVTVKPFSTRKTEKAIERGGRRMVRKLAEHQADLLRQMAPIGDRDPEFDSPDEMSRKHLVDTIRVPSMTTRLAVGGAKATTNTALVMAASHWPFALEFDTRPHEIRPKGFPRGANKLRFKGAGGEAVFASKVNHPGTKGPRLVSKTQKLTSEAAQEIVGTELRIFVNESGGI